MADVNDTINSPLGSLFDGGSNENFMLDVPIMGQEDWLTKSVNEDIAAGPPSMFEKTHNPPTTAWEDDGSFLPAPIFEADSLIGLPMGDEQVNVSSDLSITEGADASSASPDSLEDKLLSELTTFLNKNPGTAAPTVEAESSHSLSPAAEGVSFLPTPPNIDEGSPLDAATACEQDSTLNAPKFTLEQLNTLSTPPSTFQQGSRYASPPTTFEQDSLGSFTAQPATTEQDNSFANQPTTSERGSTVTHPPAEPIKKPQLARPFYLRVLASRCILSDKFALDARFHQGTNSVAEQRKRFDILTGRQIKIFDGSQAYARGHFPRSSSGSYLVAPAINSLYPQDVTSFVPHDYGLALNSEANVPQLIAWIDEERMFIPHPESSIPNLLYGANGELELGINGEVLRDFKILPRYISSAVEGWRLHFWFTCDKRIGFQDILARMHFKCSSRSGEGPLAAGDLKVKRMLQDRIENFRRESGILAPLTTPFNAETYEVTDTDIEIVSRLSRAQLQYGTWWDVDERKGVMFCPRAKDTKIPWRYEQYQLPIKGGISPRIQKILQYIPTVTPTSKKRPAPLTTKPTPTKRPRSTTQKK